MGQKIAKRFTASLRHAEIYDDGGAPFCLLCLTVRYPKSRMHDAAIGDKAQSVREEYHQVLNDLKAAHELHED
jgi:hypothetical protein